MNSLDTNILLYAINADCPEHLRAVTIYEDMLAVTLKQNGVTCFYTRNTKDFTDAGFKQLINPIDA